ncbi:MAG TPA: hypothetical protein VHI13_15865 [Candidatus Kapabacteria bacterium]|nr:hypothetical protein [Candidatus Kapabacteria bacterium]
MQSIVLFAAFAILVSTSLHAQGNWPYHEAASSSDAKDCSCFRLGVEAGTTALSGWSQEEAFSPSVPGSPFYVLETNNAGVRPSWGYYLGADIDLRISDLWRLHVRGGYAYDRVTAGDKDADVDVQSAGGPVVLGGVRQQNARGSVAYMETSLAAEYMLSQPEAVLGGRLSAFGGMALRSRTSDLLWEWDETINRPGGATFVTTVSQSRSERLILTNVARVRVGPIAGLALRWEAGSGFSVPLLLGISHWFPKIAEDESATDGSRSVTQGTSTVQLSNRDLQNWLFLRLGLSLTI